MRMLHLILIPCVSLAACSSGALAPQGDSAYRLFPPKLDDAAEQEYKVGPLDVLKITVFQEPDLSIDEIPVDASGNILFPLLGNITAAGKTAGELSIELSSRLATRFLVNPQVSIIVKESASQNVTVEGKVTRPGVYPITGTTTLLQAMAYAQGPTRTAELNDITVFRKEGKAILAARFNLDDIRKNIAANPEIRGGDIVVVGSSPTKAAFQDALLLMPALAGVFVQIAAQN